MFHVEHIRQLGWSGISLGESIKKQLYAPWGEERARGRPSAQCSTWNIIQFLQFLGECTGRGRELLRTGNARNVPRGTFFGGRAGAVWGQIAEVFHVEHFACAQARVGFSLEILPLLPLLCP